MKVFIKTLAIFFVFAISIVVAYRVYERRFYESLIPEPIEVSGTFVIDGETHLREGCGIASFWISETTLNAIRQRGLRFFDGATKAWWLTLIRRQDKREIFYPTWRATPGSPVSNALWPEGAACSDGLSRDWKQRINKAARSPGSYYTYTDKFKGSSNLKLLISPDLKMIILIYIG